MFKELLDLIKYEDEGKVLDLIARATIEDLKVTDNGGFTILHYLSQSKLLNASKALIKKSPLLLLCVDKFSQQTPLFHAIKKGNIELAEYIVLNFPIAVNHRDDRGQTLLHKVVENKHIAINNLFVEAGERKRAKTFDCTSSEWSYKKEKNKIEEKYNNFLKVILKQAPILVNAQDKWGTSAAHLAALSGDSEIIVELHKIEAKCLSILNYSEKSPIDVAYSRGHLRVVHLIEEIIHTIPKEVTDYEAILGQVDDVYECT